MATQINTSAIVNITEYPNSFKRQGAFPLERYSLFNSLEEAQAYVASNPIAYIGQTVTVSIPADPDSGTEASVKSYIIGADQQLHQLAYVEDITAGGGGGDTSALEHEVQVMKTQLRNCAKIEMPDRTSFTMDDLWVFMNKLRKGVAGVMGE